MASQTFNIALGMEKAYYNNVESGSPANSAFVVVLLQASETDDVLNNYDDLSSLLAAAGNTEADFTNYARKTLVAADLAAVPAPDDANNRLDLDLPDQTWSSAGGASNNTLTKLLICYDPDTTGGTDADIVPITHHDFALTTDGTDITAQIAAAGFVRLATS